MRCPQCETINEPQVNRCIECGWEFVPLEETVEIDKELLYEVLGTLADFLLLLEEGIQPPSNKGEIMQVQKMITQLSKAGNLE